MIKSLIINPGSTSTKLGIFEDTKLISEETLRHTTEEIAQFDKIVDQIDFRKDMILGFLKDNGVDIKSFDVIVGRGGLLKPIPSGTYEVTDELIEDLKNAVGGEHASNLGGILARSIADEIGVKSYIVDPVVVDEMADVARLSGVPELPRVSIFHALNQKAVAKRYAKEAGKAYEDLNLIVVHMGGGVSVGAHTGGKVVDVFNALSGDGAFSPERAGAVPPGALVDLCFSGKYTHAEVKKMLIGNGGYNAYLGTNNAQEVYKRSLTDDKAKLVFEAFSYQVSKDIGAMAAVLKGKVDQIILTGGIAHGEQVTNDIKERVSFIAPVTVYPGEDELLALAEGALRVINGEEEAKIYHVV
ncbi:MAG TPA: butyrate kinase [Lachnospiraceae bacterium]|nr:butyrate kinase [Lachnospiraceae bacterium]